MNRSFKDLFPRYMSMRGYAVARKGGWDTHGLPVELEVEKSLKISGKRQIEEFGVARFNELCRQSVERYIDEWEAMTDRLGFWLDMEHPYRTCDGTYIESVWWSLQQLWDRDLLYQGYKVAPYCPRCQTSLSSHELSQGYQDDVADPSVFVKFRLTGSEDLSLLAWTTTPWTLPGNVAVAVHPDATYVEVENRGQRLILARERLDVLDGDYPRARRSWCSQPPSWSRWRRGRGSSTPPPPTVRRTWSSACGRGSPSATWWGWTGASWKGRPAIAASS